jgi:hypothetical protein
MFFWCNTTLNYVTQYYPGTAALASTGSVAVTVGATTSGIDAVIVRGGEIIGTVTDATTGAAILGLCVDAFDSNGDDIFAASTDRTGAYILYGVPPGTDRVEFYSQPTSYSSPSCGGTNYLTQYYTQKSSLATADPVTVAANSTTTGVNAAMTPG